MPSGATRLTFQHFAALVAERTGGEVEIQIFPSSTHHVWSEGVDALQGGVSDISWMPADERLPCYRVTSLYPAMVDLENQVAMDAAYADLVRAEAAEVGLVPLFNSNYSYDQEWWFEEPIADLGNLEGRQVRSIGPLVSMMIETWVGSPVFVAPSEVFQSAERGVVDGINMGVATYSSWHRHRPEHRRPVHRGRRAGADPCDALFHRRDDLGRDPPRRHPRSPPANRRRA